MNGEIVPELKNTLTEANKALSAAKQTLANDSPLQEDMRETFRELNKTARSIRTLTDYLEKHPESLIRGKK